MPIEIYVLQCEKMVDLKDGMVNVEGGAAVEAKRSVLTREAEHVALISRCLAVSRTNAEKVCS